jgi:phage terminase small subunit
LGKIDILAELIRDNPTLRVIDLRVFADALKVYREASLNILENGAIVMHPRTGAPIENPYLKIQASSGAVLARMGRIKSDRVVNLLDEER